MVQPTDRHYWKQWRRWARACREGSTDSTNYLASSSALLFLFRHLLYKTFCGLYFPLHQQKYPGHKNLKHLHCFFTYKYTFKTLFPLFLIVIFISWSLVCVKKQNPFTLSLSMKMHYAHEYNTFHKWQHYSICAHHNVNWEPMDYCVAGIYSNHSVSVSIVLCFLLMTALSLHKSIDCGHGNIYLDTILQICFLLT